MNPKTKLFVIIDPESEHQLALVKALLIARLGNCQIHAFICVYEELDEHGKSVSRKDLKNKTLKQAKARLKEWMQPCRECHVSFTTEVIWNSKWYDAALHAVAKSGADLVIKSSFHHSRAQRFFHKTSDFTLMRYCPAPILFTHQAQEGKSDIMLACLDLESEDREHMKLNNSIIRHANALKDVIGMDLAIAAAYQDEINLGSLPIASRGKEGLVGELAELYGVEPENMYLRQGDTLETIGQICEQANPSIVIIGSIARTGIAGKLIGNTAENLLDLIDADVLTVN